MELPSSFSNGETDIVIAVSGGHVPFKALPLTISMSGVDHHLISANQQSPQGSLTQPLLAALGEVLDRKNAIDVEFPFDPMLSSCDDDALLAGANTLWLEGEIIQFATAQWMGDGRYKLTDLIRGRSGSIIADRHEIGSSVVILMSRSLTTFKLPRDRSGALVTARVHGPDGEAAQANLKVSGDAGRPWAPAHLHAINAAEGLRISWVRRGSDGEAWLDGVDAPIGYVQEAYRLTLTGLSGDPIDLETSIPEVFVDREVLSTLGSRPWRLEVRQLGDFSIGTPSVLLIN